jgi:hypothetical protein
MLWRRFTGKLSASGLGSKLSGKLPPGVEGKMNGSFLIRQLSK